MLGLKWKPGQVMGCKSHRWQAQVPPAQGVGFGDDISPIQAWGEPSI